jgi:hypothetical protein
MSQIGKNKNIWRLILLALLLAAIIGPWTFDLINVPAEFPCSDPFVRLEGDYCGLPIPGITLAFWIFMEFAVRIGGLFTGATTLADLASLSLIGSLFLLLLLPFFTTLLLFLGRDSGPRQLFHIGALMLVTGPGLVIITTDGLRLHWVLWGMWLYFSLAVLALVLEAFAFAQRRRSSQDS